MKLWKLAIPALFALLIFAAPGRASAAWCPAPAPVIHSEYYPAPIHYFPAESNYTPVYYRGRPYACGNHWFRIHHRRLCW